MWHTGIPGSLYVPDSIYQLVHTTGAWNPYWFHGSDAELDAMLDEMVAATDVETKKELLDQINKKLSEEAYFISDGAQNTLVLTNVEMTGFYPRTDDSSRALILADIPSR
jgi:ABC-type transport system substrate-binding protein